ncbi:MAG: DUF3189 family protein [Clostridiales bacterium]|jgi:hypothetical protein|nr:DUF3189 family protein [Clostridiales bacterium]
MAGRKIVYHCYGGTHSSVTAAAIHLGHLKPEKVPTEDELMALTLFDRQTKEGHGQLHFFGFDEQGNEIYSVGCRNVGQAVGKVLGKIKEIIGAGEELIFVDTLHCVNIKMRFGGYISRRLGFINIGRPIVLKGTQEAYPKLVELVQGVKEGAVA